MRQGETFVLNFKGTDKLNLDDIDWTVSIYRRSSNCIVKAKSDFTKRGTNNYQLQILGRYTKDWELGTWRIESMFLCPSSRRIEDVKVFRVDASVSKNLIKD